MAAEAAVRARVPLSAGTQKRKAQIDAKRTLRQMPLSKKMKMHRLRPGDADLDISQHLAETLGFPKPHYRIIERERRWLCVSVPTEFIRVAEEITDLYVAGSRLRLRAARPCDGSKPMLRLTRKADADESTRLISSVYLTEDDFAVLEGALSGSRISKIRHRLNHPSGVSMCVDQFLGPLAGLLIAEAEFDSDEALSRFVPPSFVQREITDDARFSGYALATSGTPPV